MKFLISCHAYNLRIPRPCEQEVVNIDTSKLFVGYILGKSKHGLIQLH